MKWRNHQHRATPCEYRHTDDQAPKGRNPHNRRSMTCGDHYGDELCLKGKTAGTNGIVETQLYAVLPFRQFGVGVASRRSMTCGYENIAFQATNDAL